MSQSSWGLLPLVESPKVNWYCVMGQMKSLPQWKEINEGASLCSPGLGPVLSFSSWHSPKRRHGPILVQAHHPQDAQCVSTAV